MGIGVAGPIFAHEKNQSLYEKYISKFGTRDIIIDVSGPILTHKNIKASMGQQYIYHTIWEKIVAILHIYGARAVFLLFGDHQDIGSVSCELGIVASRALKK